VLQNIRRPAPNIQNLLACRRAHVLVQVPAPMILPSEHALKDIVSRG
jgi:hypothetical protein